MPHLRRVLSPSVWRLASPDNCVPQLDGQVLKIGNTFERRMPRAESWALILALAFFGITYRRSHTSFFRADSNAVRRECKVNLLICASMRALLRAHHHRRTSSSSDHLRRTVLPTILCQHQLKIFAGFTGIAVGVRQIPIQHVAKWACITGDEFSCPTLGGFGRFFGLRVLHANVIGSVVV